MSDSNERTGSLDNGMSILGNLDNPGGEEVKPKAVEKVLHPFAVYWARGLFLMS